MTVCVSEQTLDPAALSAELLDAGTGRDGAEVTFVGRVRADDGCIALQLEHYPAMTAKALAALEAQARARWPVDEVLIQHRVGRINVGEPIVFVGVTSPHRAAAFAACQYLIDQLKTTAPFWKKELFADGERWVEARASDQAAAERWLNSR